MDTIQNTQFLFYNHRFKSYLIINIYLFIVLKMWIITVDFYDLGPLWKSRMLWATAKIVCRLHPRAVLSSDWWGKAPSFPGPAFFSCTFPWAKHQLVPSDTYNNPICVENIHGFPYPAFVFLYFSSGKTPPLTTQYISDIWVQGSDCKFGKILTKTCNKITHKEA